MEGRDYPQSSQWRQKPHWLGFNTDVVRIGRHMQLRYLAKKVANFLHEYHGHHSPRLDLPKLPSDLGKVDVHAMLEPLHIAQLLRRLTVQTPHNR
jgi:hypothetical protein